MAVLSPSLLPSVDHGAPARRRRWLAAWALLFLFVLRVSAPAATPTREYQIKAVFLFNFTQFVEWPPAAFADTQAPLVIGVLGNDPFDGFLDETVGGEKSGGRPITVRRFQPGDDVTGCQVLFISRSLVGKMDEVLARLKGRNILTVSDADSFARFGGMIRFVTVNNKIRLRINLDAARAAGLTLSSKLLRPADIVTSTDD
jgi:hypothetical protein